jgi:hypothetical protein
MPMKPSLILRLDPLRGAFNIPVRIYSLRIQQLSSRARGPPQGAESVTNYYLKDDPRSSRLLVGCIAKIGEKKYGNKTKNKSASLLNARITLDRFNQRVSE